MNRVFAIFVLCVGLFAALDALAQTEFTDTEFDFDADWTAYGPFNTPPDAANADFRVMQRLSGGNPEAYGKLTLTRATVNSGEVATWAAIINENLVWDPKISGGIGYLNLNSDWRRPVGTGDRVLSLAMRQDGFVWMALMQRKFLREDDWQILSIPDLVEENFVALPGSDAAFEDQPLHPDFSANGGPIAFGVGTGMSCPTTSDCTITAPRSLDIDNLRVEVCPSFTINAGLNDAWFNLETAGQGFFFTVFPELEAMFVAWFTYDTERPDDVVTAFLGEPGHRWLTAFGNYSGDSVLLDVELTSGGVFDAGEPAVEQEAGYGTITIVFCDCGNATLMYDFPSPGLAGTIELTRIAADNVPMCEALNAQLQMQ